MAATTTTDRSVCSICRKTRGILKCEGCLKIFCHDDYENHREELNIQLDEVKVTLDLFRQILVEQTAAPQRHTLIQKIDDWERESIDKVQQTAGKARQLLMKPITRHINRVEIKLNQLTDEIRPSHENNDFVETEIHQWKEKLTELENELTKPSDIDVRQDFESLVANIHIDLPGKCVHSNF
jgi:chromosome segregation ATPase